MWMRNAPDLINHTLNYHLSIDCASRIVTNAWTLSVSLYRDPKQQGNKNQSVSLNKSLKPGSEYGTRKVQQQVLSVTHKRNNQSTHKRISNCCGRHLQRFFYPNSIATWQHVLDENLSSPSLIIARSDPLPAPMPHSFTVAGECEVAPRSCLFRDDAEKQGGEFQIGILVSANAHGRLEKVESQFGLLSLGAFKQYFLRKPVPGAPYCSWLPVPLSHHHYNRIRHLVESSLFKLFRQASLSDYSPVDVLYTFMNDIVVGLCIEAETGFARSSLACAAEKAIESYYHAFHLLLCIVTEDERRVGIVNRTIQDFLNGKNTKTDMAYFRHFLITVLIADSAPTLDLLIAIVRETVIRNVVWMLDKRGADMPELCYIEANPTSHYRLQRTFQAARSDYRLLMFLNLFRKTINRGKKTLVQLREELFVSYGVPPLSTPTMLLFGTKRLQQVKDMHAFFDYMGLKPPSASHSTMFLRNCLGKSMQRRYSVWGISQQQALTLRKDVDPEVQEREVVNIAWQTDPISQGCFFPPGSDGDFA